MMPVVERFLINDVKEPCAHETTEEEHSSEV
jgi:hypothetical protein